MTLHDLLSDVEVVALEASSELQISKLQITGLHYDSRRVLPGHVFFALAGVKTDGSRFVDQARDRGAVAVVSEQQWGGPPGPPAFSPPTAESGPGGPLHSGGSAFANSIPWIQVRNGRRALAA